MKKLSKELILERHKVFIEYLKFVTTLSTGSIVILISFIEKLTAQPEVGYLIGVSLVCFMISIVACLAGYTIFLFQLGIRLDDIGVRALGVALLVAWISFMVATGALTIFGLRNLY